MRKLVLVAILFINLNVFSQFFSLDMGYSQIHMFRNSAFDWGDYNNDGLLDFMIVGNNSQGLKFSRLYQNFIMTLQENTTHPFVGLRNGDLKWGDYDNDGDMDFVYSGSGQSVKTHFFQNSGYNTFTDFQDIIPKGVTDGAVDWGDYDNDGDLDLIICGFGGLYGGYTYIYKNNGNSTFTKQSSIILQPLSYSSAEWCDLNNDGYKDILLSGHTGTNHLTTIYKNNGDNTFSEQVNTGLINVSRSSSALGDLDDDRDLDILMSGASDDGYVTKVYTNNGNFNFTPSSDTLVGVTDGDVCWGDYDNDGDLDVLVSGMSENGRITKVYSLEANHLYYELTGCMFAGVDQGDNAWVDYNYDGRLDIVLTGRYTLNVRFYENNSANPNSIPVPPDGLNSTMLNDSILLFTWNKAFDNETSQNALTYNIMIGSSMDVMDLKSPQSLINSGARQVLEMGNVELDTFFLFNIKNIVGCTDIYWSVQTIDHVYRGSEFAETEIAHANSFTSNNQVNICQGDSVLWRGDYYSQSGIYSVPFETVNGCDSIITLDLTVNYNDEVTDVQVACDAYTWIDGNTYNTSNTTANYTLTNLNGCDSLITLDLTVNYSDEVSDVQEACDAYTWIDGNTYNSSNNTAIYTLTNLNGCDSIITLDLTINASDEVTDVQEACDTYTWIDGNTYSSSNNTASHTLSNINGCDSLITLDLTIHISDYVSDVQEACDAYTWIDGNSYSASNTSASYTLSNLYGCDSVITLALTINASDEVSDVQEACDAYTWIDGNTYYENNNTATYTLENSSGCDSTVTLDLIINTVNTGVTLNDPDLSSDVSGAAYQWLDCNLEFSTIDEATEQSFTAETNGLFAVEVTQNNCVDTSDCVQIATVNIKDLIKDSFRLYPNPTKNEFFVKFESRKLKVESVGVYDITGKMIKNIAIEEDYTNQTFDISDLDEGIYWVKVGEYVRKLVVE